MLLIGTNTEILTENNFFLKIEDRENAVHNINVTNFTSKVICLSCKEIVINFYEFYLIVLTNQSFFLEYTDKIKSNGLAEQVEPRFLFTIKSNDVSFVNNFENLEYKLESVVVDPHKPFQPENVELTSRIPAQNNEISNENLDSTASDDIGYNEESTVKNENDKADYTDSDSNNMTLFSRKNIDELLPDHLKVRTSKEKSDAQIKEFVNLVCDICKNSTQFNSFKELQEHFKWEHNQRGYVECCDKKFYRKDRMINHITNHIDPSAFK